MQTVGIKTSQNIEIDYEVAGLGERILGWLIDLGAFLAILIVYSIFNAIVSLGSLSTIIIAIIYAAVYVFYDLLCEVFLNGQSIGKRVMKIKVVSIDGSRPSFGQYLIRWLFRIADFTITFGTGALISVAVSEKSQRIGDLVAGTTLIKTTPRVQMDAIVFRPTTTSDYEPVFTQVANLNDRDINLVHEVLINFNKTANTVLVYNMATRIKDHLAINTDMDDYRFLQTIIKDYNHISAALDLNV